MVVRLIGGCVEEWSVKKMDAKTQENFYKTGYGREVLKNKLKNYFNHSEIV